MKDKNCHPSILHKTKSLFKYEEEIKTFPDKEKLGEFNNRESALEEMLKGDLLLETKRQKYTKL